MESSPAPLDHWHLWVTGKPNQCGPFSMMAQYAALALGEHIGAVEAACDKYPSRTHTRCDQCGACRIFDLMERDFHWLQKMRDAFYLKRDVFEMERRDSEFNEILPDGVRLRVRLWHPDNICPLYDQRHP